MLAHSTLQLAHLTLNTLADQIYAANVKAGWYTNPVTRRKIDRDPMTMLMLIVTEVSEAAEGWRKNLSDDHLPHHKMLTVEMADALIRVFDLIGYVRANPEKFPDYAGLDFGQAFIDKLLYNAQRADHTLDARAEANGKKC